MSKITKQFKVNGILTDMTSVVLSSKDLSYGIKRLDTSAVVVSNNTPMIKESTGTYSYEFTDPEVDLTYQFSIKFVYGGAEYYIVEQFSGPSSVILGAYYCSLSNANDIISTFIDSESWDSATDTNKNKALSEATRIIDSLNYIGNKYNSNQDGQFPRGDNADLPNDIIMACAIIAFDLINGVDPEIERENLRLRKAEIGDIKSTYDTLLVSQHFMLGVTSARAFRYIKPYLRDFTSVRIRKV